MADTYELQAAAYTAVKDDATLKALTRADASDPRVYQFGGEKERTVSTTYPAFVTMYDPAYDDPFLSRESVQLSVTAHARSLNLCKDLADRFDTVLHRQDLNATGWTDVSMTRLSQTTIFNSSRGVWELECIYGIQAAA